MASLAASLNEQDLLVEEGCDYAHLVTVNERVVRIPVGRHHGREHCGDNTPLSDCLIRKD